MILKGWFSIPLVNMSLGSSKNRAYLPTIGLSWFIQCLSNVYPMFIQCLSNVYHGLSNVYHGLFNGLSQVRWRLIEALRRSKHLGVPMPCALQTVTSPHSMMGFSYRPVTSGVVGNWGFFPLMTYWRLGSRTAWDVKGTKQCPFRWFHVDVLSCN